MIAIIGIIIYPSMALASWWNLLVGKFLVKRNTGRK
jgi:hypothetical protein